MKSTKEKEPTIAKPALTNVDALDAASTDLRDALQQAIRDQFETQARIDQAEREYNALAGRKYAGEAVQAALDAAAGQLDRETRAHNEVSRAVNVLQLQIAELQDQREDAKRGDAAIELAATAPGFEALSNDLDRALDEVAEKLLKWRDQALQRHQLSRKAGRSI